MLYANSYKLPAILTTCLLAVGIGLLITFTNITPFAHKASVIFGITASIVILTIYLFITLRDPFESLPFIIYTLWIVIFEPAICDVFASIAILALILNIFTGKVLLNRIAFSDIMFIMFFILNINNIFNTEDIIYSFKHLLITAYLIGFYFLISNLATSYDKIHKVFKLYYIPVIITFLAMALGFIIIHYFSSHFDLLRGFIVLGNRPKGFFKDPNVAGPFLVPAVIYLLLTILNMRHKNILGLVVLLIVSVVGVFLSFSRGAIITMMFSIVLAVLFSVNRKNVVRIALCIILGLSFLFVFISYSPYAKQSGRIYNKEYGVENRIERLNKGLQILKENPLFGVGMIGIKNDAEPHDTYFLIFKRTGFVGAICFWSAIIYLLLKLLINYSHTQKITHKIVQLTLTISLLSLMLSGIAVSFLHWRHFWLIAGLSIASIRISENDLCNN